MHKVLIVDDCRELQKLWQLHLQGTAEVFSALTIEEAEKIFSHYHTDLCLICMDACVPASTPNTLPLVRKMRQTYKGHMIAISTMSEYRKLLKDAGCDEEVDKELLPTKIEEFISLLSKG